MAERARSERKTEPSPRNSASRGINIAFPGRPGPAGGRGANRQLDDGEIGKWTVNGRSRLA